MGKHLLAIDQGTSGTTALVLSTTGATLGRKTIEFPQHYPKPGWVSHDTNEIWASVETAVKEALRSASLDATSIAAIGITNQRETTALWDRKTGVALDLAIVWQCRRTADVCDRLKKDERIVARVREKTGLVIDAYFSGTKIAWLLDHIGGARERALQGEVAFGTIDSYLVHRLTSGDVHATDVTNASRTLLMNLARTEWDPELCELFRVPPGVLPKIVGSAEVIGKTRSVPFLPDGIPIAGIAGDQQAALFGQACFAVGDAKCTYGTGAFVLSNIGDRPILSRHGLVTTVAWRIGPQTTYALEGSAFVAGAAVQWLRDGLGIIKSAKDIEELARSVSSSDGVSFVPALAGLGAPYWDQGARGTISGITRGTTAAHLARATLEGIAFEVGDLLSAMNQDTGRKTARLRIDGGAASNDLLVQFQADVSNVTVERPTDIESTGRGAAMLAGLGSGLFGGLPDVANMVSIGARFEPKMQDKEKIRSLGAVEGRCRANENVMTRPRLQSTHHEPYHGDAVTVLDEVVNLAVSQRASDIHLEPKHDRLQVRFRVDGAMVEQRAISLEVAQQVVSRVKVLARMDIAERRLPQDGQLMLDPQGTRVHLRASTFPSSQGEKLVLRLLFGQALLSVDQLGMDEMTLTRMRDIVTRPQGFVVACGPTGSGKTSTLYSFLQLVDTTRVNVVTLEDPIEVEVYGITQGQTNARTGFTFSSGLRSVLRQDPDVILVGEIRDAETAGIALQAALTGHFVMSTLHTSDTVETIVRLVDLGIEPWIIANALSAVVAQRLVRLACTECREMHKLEADLWDGDEVLLVAGSNIVRPRGCNHCLRTGYRGRTGIFEALEIDDELRDLIKAKATAREYRNVLKVRHVKSLRRAGFEKVLGGTTTVDEVVRVTI